jgi:hypothetical protein
VTYTSISASYYPTRGAPPITCIRVVQPDDIDYSKVRRVARLEEKIRGGLPIDEVTRTFDRIQEIPPIPAVDSDDGERRRQRRGGNAGYSPPKRVPVDSDAG